MNRVVLFFNNNGSKSVVISTPAVSLGKLLEMWILGPHTRHPESETLGWSSAKDVLISSPRLFWRTLNTENPAIIPLLIDRYNRLLIFFLFYFNSLIFGHWDNVLFELTKQETTDLIISAPSYIYNNIYLKGSNVWKLIECFHCKVYLASLSCANSFTLFMMEA